MAWEIKTVTRYRPSRCWWLRAVRQFWQTDGSEISWAILNCPQTSNPPYWRPYCRTHTKLLLGHAARTSPQTPICAFGRDHRPQAQSPACRRDLEDHHTDEVRA